MIPEEVIPNGLLGWYIQINAVFVQENKEGNLDLCVYPNDTIEPRHIITVRKDTMIYAHFILGGRRY